MYGNILVPIALDDTHQDKVTQAIAIARALAEGQARITLLHVMEAVPNYVATYLPADYTAQAKLAIEQKLHDLATDIPGGVGVVIAGHSGRTILDFAKVNHNDLIVIASHRPGMSDLLLGSTASQVVRHAQCAVHVLR